MQAIDQCHHEGHPGIHTRERICRMRQPEGQSVFKRQMRHFNIPTLTVLGVCIFCMESQGQVFDS
jgi:hypothetical protein